MEKPEIVEQLLATCKREHPFITQPDHIDTHGEPTPSYSEDVLKYNRALSQWVQVLAKQQGVTIHIYRLSPGRRVKDTYYYDLTVDGVETLHQVHHQECYEYILHQMNNEDLYSEAHMHTPQSGRDLRRDHNEMEASYAADGTYMPQYSYQSGPFTSEKQE